MKILVVSQYFYPEQFRVSDVCIHLTEMGHEVTVLTGLPNYPMGKVFDGYNWEDLKEKNSVIYDASLHAFFEYIHQVKVIRCKLIPRKTGKVNLAINYLSFWLQGCKTAKAMADNPSEYQFDRILIFQYSPVTMALPAIQYKKRARTSAPLCLYCFDLWPESIVSFGLANHGPIYASVKALSKYIYKKMDRIFVSSKNFKKYFEIKYNIKENISHLPIYAEELFHVTEENPGQAFDSDQPMKKSFDFLFAGNIGEMQSLDTIIRAANYINQCAWHGSGPAHIDQTPTISFHIIGDGSSLEKNIQLANELSLNEHNKIASITFHGRHPLEDMPGFYDLADAFLVTLKNDPFISYTLPGKVQSYMAYGKPILAAINGETAEVIKESGCGLVCPAEDYRELAENILKFVNLEKNERLSLGVHAKMYYDRNFSSEAFYRTLTELLA